MADTAEPDSPELPTKRPRGRPKRAGKGKIAKRTSPRAATKAATTTGPSSQQQEEDESLDAASDEEGTASRNFRRPGDYTLTPLLLSESETAWIHCTICGDAFVQHDAYFTRSACPRCERHSKLYGYQWPKTQKDGKHDKEERVLDHRQIHRFLDPEDEAKIRGRKYPYAQIRAGKAAAAKPGLKKRRSSGQDKDDDYDDTESCDGEGGSRRMNWRRRGSLKG